MDALANRGELDDPLEKVVVAMGQTENGRFYAYGIVEKALGTDAALSAIVEDFATADSFRRELLMELLSRGPRRGLSETYRQLLELPLSDEEHEWLSHDLERAIEEDTPSPPITDWHLPAEEAPSTLP